MTLVTRTGRGNDAADAIMTQVKVLGTRRTNTPPMADQAALARTAALLRGTPHLAPRGVYRFSSFEEADAWMTRTIRRTHAHPNRKTSSESAAR